MKTYWMSSKKMTIYVDIDRDGIILEGSPIVKRFFGQKMDRLTSWMRAQGGFQMEEIKTYGKTFDMF
jgi:hypothetical protein